MSKKVEDFLESQKQVGQSWLDGKAIQRDEIDPEDLEVIVSYMKESNGVALLTLMGTELTAYWGFALGVMWSKYKAQYDDPLNEMLKGVDI